MTLELMERAIEFFLDRQANTEVTLEKITVRLNQVGEQQQKTSEHLAILTADLVTLTADQRKIKNKQYEMSDYMDLLTNQMMQLTTKVDSLTGNVNILTVRVGSLTDNISNLTTKVDALTDNVSVLAQTVSNLVKPHSNGNP